MASNEETRTITNTVQVESQGKVRIQNSKENKESEIKETITIRKVEG